MRIGLSSKKTGFIAGLLIVIVLWASVAFPGTRPVLNDGHKWRIGYYEGGPYINYPMILTELVKGLAELGWMELPELPEIDDPKDSREVWRILVTRTKSDYLEFVEDAFWSADWSKEKRMVLRDRIITRLNIDQDIDFMIAAGTWAGLDLANKRHSTPTMAISVSDPVYAGMSATEEYSGLNHFHARCDPTRYTRQVRLFHRLIGFKRLGLVFEDSTAGRAYAAYDDIQRIAAERRFSVVTCEVPSSLLDLKQTTDLIIKCHEQLAQDVDAVFVTTHRGIVAGRMDELVKPFLEHKIPTWSQRGLMDVQRGILYSTTGTSYEALGGFHARVMARALNGEALGTINQVFTNPDFIAVNTKVADIIGYKVPGGILKIADEIYNEIENQ